MSQNKLTSVQSFRPLGAVPVRNEKGEMTMQKVKVDRYVSGRKPKYAEQESTSGSEPSDDELDYINEIKVLPSLKTTSQKSSMAFTLNKQKLDEQRESDDDDDDQLAITTNQIDREEMIKDPRMRRLIQFRNDSHKHHSKNFDKDEDIAPRRHREVIDAEEDEENIEDNIERRHESLKQRMAKIDLKPNDGAFSDHSADDDEDEEEDEESEYEEYTDSEEDNTLPRLKPIFIPKKDRITIIEKEEEEQRRLEMIEIEKKLAVEERRKATLKLIEEERRKEEEEAASAKASAEEEAIIQGIASILTDDEDEETAFELWKVRELRRIKRDKEEEDEREKERREIERLRNMTEEERQEELKKNPRLITNQQKKGKYKFLQKYFHRGAFYLDEEDQVFKRDFAQPTLEDHFDKSTLPSVMQVKNFGRAGRTKYTHLTDQDTTAFDHAWGAKDNAHGIQFAQQHGGGMRQAFERPGKRKK